MGWLTKQHDTRPSVTAKIVDYRCQQCGTGHYKVDLTLPRVSPHNQIPHKCDQCAEVAYFVAPYPLVLVNDEPFVHWDTIRSVGSEPPSFTGTKAENDVNQILKQLVEFSKVTNLAAQTPDETLILQQLLEQAERLVTDGQR